jgi:O-antigen/teichoic acid export membrane protein
MLLAQSSIYFITKIVPAVITLVALAAFSHFLSPREYGLVAWTLSVVMLTFNVAYNWLCSVVVRLHPAQATESAFSATIFSVFIVLVFLSALAVFAASLSIRDEDLRRLLTPAWLMLTLLGWMEINLAFFMARLRAGLYGTLNVVRAILSAVLGSLFAYLGLGAAGVIGGMVLAMLIPSMWLFGAYWRKFSVRTFNVIVLRDICSYGLPLAAGYAMYGLATNVDRQILIAFEGASTLGLYAIGFELAQKTIGAVMAPIGTAGLPLAIHALEERGESAAAEQLSANCVLLTAIGLPSTVGLVLLAPDVANVMLGEKFRHGAVQVLPICAAAAFLNSFRSFYVDHAFTLGKKTAKLLKVMLAIASISLVLNCSLIPILGLVGAAYAALGTHFIGVLVGLVVGRRTFKLQIPLMEILRIGTATAIMSLVIISADLGDGIFSLVTTVALGGAAYTASCIMLDVAGTRNMIVLKMTKLLQRRRV